jgi:hypothetical protein
VTSCKDGGLPWRSNATAGLGAAASRVLSVFAAVARSPAADRGDAAGRALRERAQPAGDRLHTIRTTSPGRRLPGLVGGNAAASMDVKLMMQTEVGEVYELRPRPRPGVHDAQSANLRSRRRSMPRCLVVRARCRADDA